MFDLPIGIRRRLCQFRQFRCQRREQDDFRRHFGWPCDDLCDCFGVLPIDRIETASGKTCHSPRCAQSNMVDHRCNLRWNYSCPCSWNWSRGKWCPSLGQFGAVDIPAERNCQVGYAIDRGMVVRSSWRKDEKFLARFSSANRIHWLGGDGNCSRGFRHSHIDHVACIDRCRCGWLPMVACSDVGANTASIGFSLMSIHMRIRRGSVTTSFSQWARFLAAD